MFYSSEKFPSFPAVGSCPSPAVVRLICCICPLQLFILMLFLGFASIQPVQIIIWHMNILSMFSKSDLNLTMFRTTAINLNYWAFWGYPGLFTRWFRTKVSLEAILYNRFRISLTTKLKERAVPRSRQRKLWLFGSW